ncbi:hypothetical protein [Burkholderia plantarii]|uniref:hypothetical protein n=1 Tax=Burkholderia plantarii TaxID=41899 RepID=UPI00149590D5|nr:hypothetical protein [Burkholderia plantarii]
MPQTYAQQVRLGPVSYTHLDVYKRQVRARAADLRAAGQARPCLLYTSRCV